MWVVVMFGIPVVEKSERKAATAFRHALLGMGFAMLTLPPKNVLLS